MRKVLVVEDDRFISAIFSMFLRDAGHEMVGRCQTGLEALELCKTAHPEVVLMDIHLEGDLDGIQTANRIMRDYHIPVIFISSDTDNDIIRRAIVSNSYGYLVKPIARKELIISIDLAFYKHQADQELKEREKGFRQFISDSPLSIVIVSNGNLQYINNNALSLFRSHYIEDVLGTPFVNFVMGQIPAGLTDLVTKGTGLKKQPPVFRLQLSDIHRNGFFVELTASLVEFNKRKSIQLILRDITSELREEVNIVALRLMIQREPAPWFLVGNDMSLIDYSESITGFKELKPDADTLCQLNNQQLAIADDYGNNLLGDILSSEDLHHSATFYATIDSQSAGQFSFIRIPSSVPGFSAVLFVGTT